MTKIELTLQVSDEIKSLIVKMRDGHASGRQPTREEMVHFYNHAFNQLHKMASEAKDKHTLPPSIEFCDMGSQMDMSIYLSPIMLNAIACFMDRKGSERVASYGEAKKLVSLAIQAMFQEWLEQSAAMKSEGQSNFSA